MRFGCRGDRGGAAPTLWWCWGDRGGAAPTLWWCWGDRGGAAPTLWWCWGDRGSAAPTCVSWFKILAQVHLGCADGAVLETNLQIPHISLLIIMLLR
jgi:hypothetical protein